MKKRIGFLLIVFIAISPSLAEREFSFDAQAAWSYIKALASDAMRGRKSGQPSAVLAEQYLAEKFREWGLEPAGDNQTYFQNFTIEHRNIGVGAAMEIVTERERRNFYYGDDWRVQRFSGSGHFTTEMVFAGYGIHAPENDYDDYAGVDVKGKMVLFASDIPSKIKDKLKKKAEMTNRIKAAQDLGALGAMVIRQSTTTSRYFRLNLKKEIYKPDFAILSAEERVTKFLFKDLKTETRSLFREINRSSKPKSFQTGVKARISVDAIFDEKRPTRNVLAKITGVDESLRNEYVVIGAHMDHLGINPLGEVMNGANDNASGTAVVIEVARIMKLNRAKPKRTVVFALWAAEEQGLLGSKHYVDNTPYSIDKTVAYINMDMVGHGTGKISFMGVYYGPKVWKTLKEKLPEDIRDYVKPSRGGPGGSDHTAFMMKGVPAYFLITSGSLKYHQSRDDSDLINPEMLKKTGDFVHAAVKVLASEPIDFIQPMRQERYHLKYQRLINYKLSPLNRFVEHHRNAKDSHVDLQLSVVEEKEGLEGDALRIDILQQIIDTSENLRGAEGLTFYSSSRKLIGDIRQGKTTVMVGLRGIRSFVDYPKWAQVLAKQGVSFVVIDDPSLLFAEGGLSEKGMKVLKALNTSGILMGIKGIDAGQAKSLMNASKKPLIVLSPELPDKEVQDLIKKTESALGLILREEDDPVAYFARLDEAKKSMGSGNLMIVNEPCLWGEEGQGQMLQVISNILKAGYGRSNISDLFSGTFLRVMREASGEEGSMRVPYIPF